MAGNPIIKIEVTRFNTARQRKLLARLGSKPVQKQVNTILKDYINAFVPKKSGALRRSAIVTHNTISWGRRLKYARYQYNGQIYGKNYPIVRGGRIVGWYSKPGVPKYPTGRMMGPYTKGNEWMGYMFGYSEPGTEHHWDVKFKNDRRWKAAANREITAYIKKECKKAGVKT